MIALYFLLDVVFYNYTGWATQIFLLTFLEKENKKVFTLLFAFIIDYLLFYKGKFFLLFLILYFVNKQVRLSYYRWSSSFLRFLLLFFIYQLVIVGITKNLYISPFGFLINLIFVAFSYKNAPNS